MSVTGMKIIRSGGQHISITACKTYEHALNNISAKNKKTLIIISESLHL